MSEHWLQDPYALYLRLQAIHKTKAGHSGSHDLESYRTEATKLYEQLYKYDQNPPPHRRQNSPKYTVKKAQLLVLSALAKCMQKELAPPKEIVRLLAYLFVKDDAMKFLDHYADWPRADRYYVAAEYLALNPGASSREVKKRSA